MRISWLPHARMMVYAADASSRYPNAQVIGADLVEGQFDPSLSKATLAPDQQQSNITWRVPNSPLSHGPAIDFEDPTWDFPTDYFSYIRLGHVIGSITSWPSILTKCLTHLLPANGYIEITDIDWQARSANGPLRANSPFADYWDRLQEASSREGRPFRVPHRALDGMLKDAGFDTIVHQRYRLPLCPWSRDERQEALGRNMAAVLEDSLVALGIGLLPFSPDLVRAYAKECVRVAQRRENRMFVML